MTDSVLDRPDDVARPRSAGARLSVARLVVLLGAVGYLWAVVLILDHAVAWFWRVLM